LLLEAFGQEYFYSTQSLATVNGTQSYSLPSTFYQMLGVDVDLGGGEYMSIRPYNFHERNAHMLGFGWGYPDGVQYRIMGSKIYFIPVPTAVENVLLHYIPYPTSLSADGDTFDGINGWEEYVVVDCAAKMLEKEESNADHLYKRKAELQQRIQGMASRRDAGFPERVVDIHANTWRYY
jgi:hypothetical protein